MDKFTVDIYGKAVVPGDAVKLFVDNADKVVTTVDSIDEHGMIHTAIGEYGSVEFERVKP